MLSKPEMSSHFETKCFMVLKECLCDSLYYIYDSPMNSYYQLVTAVQKDKYEQEDKGIDGVRIKATQAKEDGAIYGLWDPIAPLKAAFQQPLKKTSTSNKHNVK